jgi:hypothetical protein
MTQSRRLLAYLRANPGATSLEITLALSLVNVTGRVSDLRAAGYVVECRRRTDGRDGYWLVEKAQLELALA